MRLAKVVLAVMAHISSRNLPESSTQTTMGQATANCIATENIIKAVAARLTQHMQNDNDTIFFLGGVKPDADVIRSLVRLAWASSSSNYQLLVTPWDELGSIKLGSSLSPIQENEYSEDILLSKYDPFLSLNCI